MNSKRTIREVVKKSYNLGTLSQQGGILMDGWGFYGINWLTKIILSPTLEELYICNSPSLPPILTFLPQQITWNLTMADLAVVSKGGTFLAEDHQVIL